MAAKQSPIICSPFAEPDCHWKVERGQTPFTLPGRRPASYFFRVPERAGRGRANVAQQDLLDKDAVGSLEELAHVNLLRQKLKDWRDGALTGRPYDGVTAVTHELLTLWRSEDRLQRLFFAQIEAAETIIFLAEALPAYRKGLPEIPTDQPNSAALAAGTRAFRRYACKMATGTGKTTVMGMLAAWSILNAVAAPSDERFTDTVLIICPNVTIRDRLAELDPALGDISLYRTRQLVPVQRMGQLRQGEVMVANWHKLARLETGKVNGQTARVVKTGVPIEVVKNAGRANETREIRYFESDRAWYKRIRQELGSGRGRSNHWFVLNDEAHHAYRRGEGNADEALEGNDDVADLHAREATIWIDGLDRINRLAGGKSRGIRMCVDLSATPFYIQGSGNEVGRPFAWIVSDFSLLDSIESGLVKIPQLPARDVTGKEEARYFNIWRWVEQALVDDGVGGAMTPDKLLRYASAPINTLAQDWQKRFAAWQQRDKHAGRHAVPPVFIIVCRDTKLAKAVYQWLAEGEGDYGQPPAMFRNTPAQEYTVRIDSKVAEDIDAGGSSDEARRLRFVLDTVGKTQWPGNRVPDEYSALVAKHNDKTANDDSGELSWVNEAIPPGRDVRCIISVAMLSEGWDANTVTHVVGLRPFGSQLLCEQVIGRALRRRSYALQANDRFAEETARVFGVPFELVPFEVKEPGDPGEAPEPVHVFAMPERAEFEVTAPVVTGYVQQADVPISLDLDALTPVTLDASRIPDSVQLNSLAAVDGALAAWAPGDKPVLTLDEWRSKVREQQVAFVLANAASRLWIEEHDSVGDSRSVFPRFLLAATRLVDQHLTCVNGADVRDVLVVGDYFQAARERLMAAVRQGGPVPELPAIPRGEAGRVSTRFLDFHTLKPTWAADKTHANLFVADTKSWEQQAAYVLDTHDAVVRWAKNERLDFKIPYRKGGTAAYYFPDFIVVLNSGQQLIVEIKGQHNDDAKLKSAAAERWVAAVNQLGTWGDWAYAICTQPGDLKTLLSKHGMRAKQRIAS